MEFFRANRSEMQVGVSPHLTLYISTAVSWRRLLYNVGNLARENVASHMIEPSYGRNLKSTVFSSWATCYMRQCVDKTAVSNDLRLEIERGIT